MKFKIGMYVWVVTEQNSKLNIEQAKIIKLIKHSKTVVYRLKCGSINLTQDHSKFHTTKELAINSAILRTNEKIQELNNNIVQLESLQHKKLKVPQDTNIFTPFNRLVSGIKHFNHTQNVKDLMTKLEEHDKVERMCKKHKLNMKILKKLFQLSSKGYNNAQIAKKLKYHRVTIQRYTNSLRKMTDKEYAKLFDYIVKEEKGG